MIRNTIIAGLGLLLLLTVTHSQATQLNLANDRQTGQQMATTKLSDTAVVPVQAATPSTVSVAQPAVAKAPEPAPVVNGCDAVFNLASQYTDWSPTIMTRIANAESGCRFDAVGDGHLAFYNAAGTLIGMSCGPWQVRVLDGRPSCAQLQDPQITVEWAHRIYLSQGFSAWSVCTSGKAACYN